MFTRALGVQPSASVASVLLVCVSVPLTTTASAASSVSQPSKLIVPLFVTQARAGVLASRVTLWPALTITVAPSRGTTGSPQVAGSLHAPPDTEDQAITASVVVKLRTSECASP